jgi:hypothetical protein
MRTFSIATPWMLTIFMTMGLLLVRVQAQVAISGNANLLYNLGSNYQFKAADSLIAADHLSARNDPGFQLAAINFYWWKLISGNDNEKYAQRIDSIMGKMESKIKHLENRLGNNQRFLLICAYAYSARIDLMHNAYVPAIAKLGRYHALIKPSFGQEKEYPAYYLTSGLYHFFTAYAKSNIPLIGSLISRYAEKDKETGWQYLKIAATSPDKIIRNEANYFLMRIAYDLHHNHPEAARYCDKLLAEYPNNLRYHFYRVQINLALHQTARAKQLIDQMQKIANQNPNLSTVEREYFIKLAKEALLNASKI